MSLMKFFCRLYQISCLVVFSCTLIGCGDGRTECVPVSGRVLIDGEPVTHGFVRFVPEHGRVSTGSLNDEGRFVLTCFEQGDGAALGKHRIAVCAVEQLNEDQMRWLAPKAYANHGTSDLEQEVTGPTDSVTINLTWKGGAPFVEGTRAVQGQSTPDDE